MQKSEAAAAPRFARTWRPPAAYRRAALARDRNALGEADHALALASGRVTAAKAKVAEATAMVDDTAGPGQRLRCEHERPTGAEPVARHPARPLIFLKHSFSPSYAMLAPGAVISCRFSCRNAPTQHLLFSHGPRGLIAHGRSRAPEPSRSGYMIQDDQRRDVEPEDEGECQHDRSVDPLGHLARRESAQPQQKPDGMHGVASRSSRAARPYPLLQAPAARRWPALRGSPPSPGARRRVSRG